ncbi:hypothetical protein, partial [Pseudoalteromonas sp. S1688]|uniref:hypothetical protein n=1 Tax=Pseudoalteromonas sp. S1688 TaxID=579511 RepID=UPI00128395B7
SHKVEHITKVDYGSYWPSKAAPFGDVEHTAKEAYHPIIERHWLMQLKDESKTSHNKSNKQKDDPSTSFKDR